MALALARAGTGAVTALYVMGAVGSVPHSAD